MIYLKRDGGGVLLVNPQLVGAIFRSANGTTIVQVANTKFLVVGSPLEAHRELFGEEPPRYDANEDRHRREQEDEIEYEDQD